MNFKLIMIVSIVLTTVCTACKKTPGQGGNASIKGKVWVKQYDPFFTVIMYEYYDPNRSVYITYGNNISPDQTVQTNTNGEFEITYLRKGTYTITLYSKVFADSLHPSGTVAVDTTINITERKQVIDLGTIKVQK
jgi:sensor c-di-GMP phosphodiesterase-like protein